MTQVPEHTLLPVPSDLEVGDGGFGLDGEPRIELTGVDDPRLALAVERFSKDVRQLTNSTVSPLLGPSRGAHVTVTVGERSDGPPVSPEDESYALTVSSTGVLLEARKVYGVLHGLQTLLQLIGPSADGYQIRAVRIVDQPRFAWRGLLIDAVRHWMPPHVIKRNLNAMAAVKLNVFHWHLTDDQGFRIESRRFPKLHELGSDAEFYTQEEVREIVKYAWDRGIQIVPEFDIPGHATSWFVGYPELASAPGPYSVSRRFGGHKATMDPTSENTIEFVSEFLVEMISLFPGRFIHLGGDEVDPEHWQSNPAISTYMRERGLQNPRELLVAVHNKLRETLNEHARESIGWDPLVAPGLDSRVVIESVRGQKWVAQAIRAGNRAIASSQYYLSSLRPTSFHYLSDPFDGEVSDTTDEQRALILGGEASMWTEYATAQNVDSRTWPRAAAVAERLWSRPDVRDVDDMYRRLSAVSRRLDVTGVTHRTGPRQMQSALAGGSANAAVRVLADLVEPVPLAARRELLAKFTTRSPLNRLVDTAVPDGEASRDFMVMVEAFVADPSHAARYRRLEEDLEAWAGNHERLKDVVSSAPLLAEVVPVSRALSDVAEVGLNCLSVLQAGDSLTDAERHAHTTVLESASEPMVEVALLIVSGIRALLDAVP